MAAQIQRYESKGVRQVGAHLSTPGHAALRKAMNENNGPPFGISCLDHVQSYPAASDNPVFLVHLRTPDADLGWERVCAGVPGQN
jgi:hypothetical protein